MVPGQKKYAGLTDLPLGVEIAAVILAVIVSTGLAYSGPLGEWLLSATPNVLPRAEAGANILREAIRLSKHCIRYGSDYCIDAEGRATAFYLYMSQWYLSPQQHVIEVMISFIVLAPASLLFYRCCATVYRYHRDTGTFQLRKGAPVMKLWGGSLLVYVSLGIYLKLSTDDVKSDMAYILQPCHLHSVVMAICSFWETERSRAIFHVAATLWWGPFLAFVAPDLPNEPFEIAIFYGQHTLMLLIVLFRLTVGANWMYRNFWWNSAGYVFLCCYHWWLLGPVNLVTGINVATMTVPPTSLVMFGKYYRLVWGLMCMLLQFIAVQVINVLARLVGAWPTDPGSVVGVNNGKGSVESKAYAQFIAEGSMPGDAVPVTPEQAVLLVDKPGVDSTDAEHVS
ncbi:unnamed protein product [Discosporangium mesarthrocarpum]